MRERRGRCSHQRSQDEEGPYEPPKPEHNDGQDRNPMRPLEMREEPDFPGRAPVM